MRRRLLTGMVLLFCGCATAPKHPATAPAATNALRHKLVEGLLERNRKMTSLKSFGSVRYGSRWLGAPGEVALIARAPGHLRVDGLSDFGMYDFRLSIAEGKMQILWPGQKRYFDGEATSERLKRYLLLPLGPEAAIGLLLGHVPAEDEDSYVILSRLKGRKIVLKGHLGEVVFLKNGASYVPVRYTAFDLDGVREYTIDYGDHLPEEGILFPHHIVAQFFRPHARLDIEYRDLETNLTIDKDAFTIEIPHDAVPVIE